MRMSFMPADLHVSTDNTGEHVITLAGQEVLRTRSESKALARFKQLRTEMEKTYPARQLTDQEKAEALQNALADSLVGHNSLGGRRKKTTASGTRTFGG